MAPVAEQAGPAGVRGGPLFTLRRGSFHCEWPGDAMNAVAYAAPQEDFTILRGSTYATASGRGAYLAAGETITMTTGPLAGQAYRRVSENFLRKLGPAAEETGLRCIRGVLNNSDLQPAAARQVRR